MAVLVNDQTDTPDQELVVRCQRGDRTSFRFLYRRYQQQIRSTLYQLCGAQVLDDLVQEVFLRVWKGLPKLREPSFFSTWVYRITWNVATDQRRQWAKGQSKPDGNDAKRADEEQGLSNLFRPEDAPDLMQLHYEDLVQRGLRSLSIEHRAVIVLHDLEDIPQKEVAEILDIPVGTVKSRLFHARNAVRKFLQQQGASL